MKDNKKKINKTTSWGSVAGWYDDLLEKDKDNYQSQVILPNILRIVNPKRGERILDLACGQGFFTRALKEKGAVVIGADISDELVSIAKKKDPSGKYVATPAEDLSPFQNGEFSAIVCVLALQNMKDLPKIFQEISRVLKEGGKFIFVINHPAFRIPKKTFWGWDSVRGIQYRKIDGYMSEETSVIDMNPGKKHKKETVSFHRPLQTFFKLLGKNKLYVSHLEEWISHKKSSSGPRKNSEDSARKEFPMFMCIEAVKVSL